MNLDEVIGKSQVLRICSDLSPATLNSMIDWTTFQDYRENGITIILATYGGSAEAALGMHDMIRLARESGVKVQLVVTGMCQSAGTLLLTSVPVEQRYATRHTRFMIHTCNVSGDGTSVQLKPIAPDKPAPWWRRLFMKRKRAELLKSSLVAEGYDLQRAMTDLYLTETNLTQEQLIELYRDDSYFGADKALDIGLVGHIL